MKNLKLIIQGIEKRVFIAKIENRKILDIQGCTSDFNNCVYNVFKTNDRTITNNNGKSFKVTLEPIIPLFNREKPPYLSN